jgi:hypothetical protein
MADDKTKRALQDAKLISLSDDAEIYFWTKKFGVSRERLAEAVTAVGHLPETVCAYLGEDALSYG